MSRAINDLVNEGLTQWLNLVGLDPNDKRWTEARSNTEELSESRSFDPTGLTTFMMLRSLVEQFLVNTTFTALDLLTKSKDVARALKPMQAIRNLLEEPEVVGLIGEFTKQIEDAADHYGVVGKNREALSNLLADKYDLAYVRRDALRSIERLEAHQFLRGASDEIDPKYNPQVFEFWNVNSLLAAMRSQKVGGISMILIRDPEALHSYFVFALRNGQNLMILTDRDNTPHPAFKRMSRRPDRSYSRRAERNWFPYDLVDVSVSEDQKRLYANARTSLVPLNADAVPLRKVSELGPEQFVWAIMVFDLIRDRYWKQGFQASELSYTGQMVAEPAALVGSHGALVKDGLYTPLEVPRLSREDVTAETTAGQWQDPPTRVNAWIYERYKDKVPEEVLNPVGEHARLLLVERAAELVPGEVKRWNGESLVNFESLDPLDFGSKEKLVRDRLWVARVNQMRVIQRHVVEDYERTRDEVTAWCRERIEANRAFLIEASIRRELNAPRVHFRPVPGGPFEMNVPPQVVTKNILDQREGPYFTKAYHLLYDPQPNYFVRGGKSRDGRDLCAARKDVTATIFSVVAPTCAEALAFVLGVKVEELPWQLRHWNKERPYTGNNILNRLDPEDWVLNNPWDKFRVVIGIALSKNVVHARRKELGLPRAVWEAPKND